MILSLIVYNKLTTHIAKQKEIEKFTFDDVKKVSSNSVISSFFTFLAIAFFIMEAVAMYYSVMLAIKCTKPGAERTINIILAITVTLPYILSNILFNKCIMSTLRIDRSEWVIP